MPNLHKIRELRWRRWSRANDAGSAATLMAARVRAWPAPNSVHYFQDPERLVITVDPDRAIAWRERAIERAGDTPAQREARSIARRLKALRRVVGKTTGIEALARRLWRRGRRDRLGSGDDRL